MAGLEGYVAREGGACAVIINLEALGAAVAVAVAEEDLAAA
jgi:hypothetical protein